MGGLGGRGRENSGASPGEAGAARPPDTPRAPSLKRQLLLLQRPLSRWLTVNGGQPAEGKVVGSLGSVQDTWTDTPGRRAPPHERVTRPASCRWGRDHAPKACWEQQETGVISLSEVVLSHFC